MPMESLLLLDSLCQRVRLRLETLRSIKNMDFLLSEKMTNGESRALQEEMHFQRGVLLQLQLLKEILTCQQPSKCSAANTPLSRLEVLQLRELMYRLIGNT